MKYYLIAGEASGDLHASNLMRALNNKDSKAEFSFIGGDLMEDVSGSKADLHYRSMNVMGLFAVLASLRRLNAALASTRKRISQLKPDVLILIDYADFNLRIAKHAYKNGIRVFYYISPKVWAWRRNRVKKLRKYVDQLFVIFPFEKAFFRDYGMDVIYEGNPLVDGIRKCREDERRKEAFMKANQLDGSPVIALLAGSREQEIKKCLPEMIRVSKHFPGYRFIVAGAPSVRKELYEEYLADTDVSIVYNDTYNLLSVSCVAIVTSGTATLETALFQVPQMVVYKTGNLSYFLGRLVVRFTYFSLVNLILGRELVKEFLQFGLAGKMKKELDNILNKEDYRSSIMDGYKELDTLIGENGVSDRIAEAMIGILKKK